MKFEAIGLNQTISDQNEKKEESKPIDGDNIGCDSTWKQPKPSISFDKRNENYQRQMSQQSSFKNKTNRSISFHLSHRSSLLDSTILASDHPDSISDYMSFTYVDLLILMFSICTFIFDFVTDIVVTVFHYLNEDYWYFALTIVFVAIPTIIMTIMSLRWYILDYKEPNSLNVSKMQWLSRVIFLTLQLGPVMRYIDAILYGIQFRKLNGKENKKVARRYFQYMIYEDTDATMLRLFECFMEAAPQLVLQMSIMFIKVPDKRRDWTIFAQAVSVLASLVSLSWTLVSYLRILRMSLPHKQNMTWSGTIIQFLWRFFMIASRVLVLSLFASEYTYYISIVCSVHWFLMFLWIVSMKTSFCDNQFEELFYNAILAAIFIFCYFNPVDSPSRKRYTFYYLIMFIENIIILLLWYNVCNENRWYRLPAFIVYFVSFLLALIFMAIYYLKFHPTQNIKIFKRDLAEQSLQRGLQVETTSKLLEYPSVIVYNEQEKENHRKAKKQSYKRQFSDVWTTNGRLLHPRPAVPPV